MEKKDAVSTLLLKIREQADELLDNDNVDLTAEEIVVLSVELVTSSPVTTIEYTMPVGRVDRNNMTFVLEDDFEIPIYGDESYEE